MPPPDFLEKTLPHLSDPGVGLVQARWEHLNREESLLTRIQAIFLDGHFVLESAVRFRSGHFFNFNGTAGVFRRAAIEDAGLLVFFSGFFWGAVYSVTSFAPRRLD